MLQTEVFEANEYIAACYTGVSALCQYLFPTLLTRPQ